MGKGRHLSFRGFMGNDQYRMENCEGVLDNVPARLSKWDWLLPQLSYRGRVLWSIMTCQLLHCGTDV